MALITDINTAGASAQIINARANMMQVLINGTWNGATVNLQKRISDGTWITVQSWTDNAYDVVETIGSATYRFNTTHGASAPDLKCDVTFDGPGSGSIA